MSEAIIKEALEAFDRAVECENDNRLAALEDIRFACLDEQWDASIKREREKSGRPCLTINKLKPVIRQVVNDSRQNRPSIKVHPCDSKADPDTAQVISGMIRNIEASSDAEVAYDTAIEHAVSGGFGYWRINTDYALNAVDEDGIRAAGAAAFDQDIFIKRIANPFTVYGDPYSTAADSSDWNQCHIIETLTKDQFKAKYPNAEESNFSGEKWHGVQAPWLDEETVQVAEYWKREKVIRMAYAVEVPDEEGLPETIIMFQEEWDKAAEGLLKKGAAIIGQPRPVQSYKVTQYVISGVEVLSETVWPGAYIPIVPVYGEEINVEGKRHFRSLIRGAKDAQRMFNYWRTTETETVALAPRVPYILEEGAIPKGWAGKWATANSHSHPYLMVAKGFNAQRQPPVQMPAAMMRGAMNASDDIKAITGIYDASLGARSNETTGVAIRARQMEGDVSTFHFIDNLTRAIRHSGRILIDLIPKVYSTERIVRILGEDGKAEAVTINGADRMHDIRTGRYDLTVSAGPSFTSRREEAAVQMMNLIQSYPDAAPIIGDLLAKNLDWPGADEIAERLERLLPPEARGEDGQIDPAIQQQMQEMAQAIQQLGQKLQEAESKREIELLKVRVDGYKAETERLTAVAPGFGPEQVQQVILQTLAALASDGLPNAEVAPSGSGSFEQPEMGQAY